MKNPLAICLSLVILIVFSGALHSGDIYQWRGTDGKIHYGDVPPRDATAVEAVSLRIGIGKSEAVERQGPTPALPPDIETALANGDECAYKKRQLASFRTAVSLVETDALGREREYTASERGQIVSRIEKEMAIACHEEARD